MSAGAITIDASRWPVVVHTAVGTVSDAQVDAYVRAASELLARAEPHVTVLDARRIGVVSAYTRARAQEWTRAHRAALAAHCRGTVYIVASPMLRFIVMTTLLVARLPTPYLVCETFEEALAWAHERLAGVATA